MEYSFQRYLLAKQAIDDRSLNRHVLEALRANLPASDVRVIEVGAGMGNMLARLLSWKLISHADYVHEDAMAENIQFAREWIPQWAASAGMHADHTGPNQMRISDEARCVDVLLEQVDFLGYVATKPAPADLLIAHAFLDLLPMPESMPALLSLTRNLAWLTLNFDGLTSLEPTIDRVLDEQIERLYHQSMDVRPTGGDSRSGRHMFGHLQAAGADILAAGASDWVVYPSDGKYPGDEAYFLHFILHFFEEALSGHPELDAKAFSHWMQRRREQIDCGELVYIAHQMDFLVKTRGSE